MASTGTPKLGRKRNEERTAAILAAAFDLLLETGYDHIRIQDVADRAGTSLATIYRRWETKEALVADAIRNMPDDDPPPGIEPIADLALAVRDKAAQFATNPDLIPGIVAAVRKDPDIAAAVHEKFSTQPFKAVLEPVLGPDHPQLDLLDTIIPALLLHRTALLGEAVDIDAFTAEVVALVKALAPRDSL